MRKKIVYLSQMYPYPLDGGGKIKTYNTLIALAKRYEIYAVFVSEIKPTKKELYELEKYGITVKVFYSNAVLASVKDDLINLFWHFLRGIPHYVFQYTSREASQFIQSLITSYQPDIIHIDHLNISQYLPQKKDHIWILEHHNVESYLYWTRFLHSKKLTRKLYLFVEMGLTFVYEWNTLRKFDHIFTISEAEAIRTKKIYRVSNVSAQPFIYPVTKIKHSESKVPYILFVGNLGWPPNEDAIEWFLRDIYPEIVKQLPNAEFHIVGKRQPRYEKNWPKLDTVFLHDYQKNLVPFLSRAHIFIMPFRMGGGMRIKSLTALAAGLPLISTALGVEGLNLTNGVNYIKAREASDFSHKIVELLTYNLLRRKIRKEALNYVTRNHSNEQNEVFINQYKKIIQKFS